MALGLVQGGVKEHLIVSPPAKRELSLHITKKLVANKTENNLVYQEMVSDSSLSPMKATPTSLLLSSAEATLGTDPALDGGPCKESSLFSFPSNTMCFQLSFR